jgi:hypothetical protein
MPGLARTLALRAQKLQAGMQLFAAEFFYQQHSYLVTGATSSKPRGVKKRKIKESSPEETPGDEHEVSSTSASVPSTLPLEATPFASSASSLDGYANRLAELTESEMNGPSRTFAQNVATSGAWEALLPRLVYPLMEQEQARRGRNVSPSEPPTASQCSCKQREATVLVVSFTCMCHPLCFYKDSLKGAYVSNNPANYSILPMHAPSNRPDAAGRLHLNPR